MLGIWTIKFNFLLIFFRLGHQITSYRIFWWVSTALVVSCGAVAIAIIPYRCHFGDPISIIQECSSDVDVNRVYTLYKASVAVDVCSGCNS